MVNWRNSLLLYWKLCREFFLQIIHNCHGCLVHISNQDHSMIEEIFFILYLILSSQNILLIALLTDCCSSCGHQWSMSQSFYLSRLKSFNLMRVYVWYFSYNIDTSLLTRVITQQTWGQCQCHVQLLVHVAVTFRLYLKPQLNLLEKVRCVWNQILIDVQNKHNFSQRAWC